MKHLAIFILLIGCGIEEFYSDLKPHRKIVQLGDFEEYVDMFERDSVKYGKGIVVNDLIIKFGDVDKPDDDVVTLGTCTTRYNTTPIITIDTNRWSIMSDTRRKVLMYHELGHCILDRSHVPSKDDGGQLSIMNPFIIDSFTFNVKKDKLIRELFNGDSILMATSTEQTHGECYHD